MPEPLEVPLPCVLDGPASLGSKSRFIVRFFILQFKQTQKMKSISALVAALCVIGMTSAMDPDRSDYDNVRDQGNHIGHAHAPSALAARRAAHGGGMPLRRSSSGGYRMPSPPRARSRPTSPERFFGYETARVASPPRPRSVNQ
jgi:hypothetical protein